MSVLKKLWPLSTNFFFTWTKSDLWAKKKFHDCFHWTTLHKLSPNTRGNLLKPYYLVSVQKCGKLKRCSSWLYTRRIKKCRKDCKLMTFGELNQKTVTGQTALIKSEKRQVASGSPRTRVFDYLRQKPVGRWTRISDHLLETKLGKCDSMTLLGVPVMGSSHPGWLFLRNPIRLS